MVPVSLRMKKIADMVSVSSVADIGCDHGFVSIYLILEKGLKYVIAMDINEGPLQRAKEHVGRYGLTDKIDIRRSDGAKELKKSEVNGAIIAGMGGRLTIRILSNSLEIFKNMEEVILSPHSEVFLVRRFLSQNGFDIIDEDMVIDEEKYYPIIKCVYKDDNVKTDLSDIEEEFGPIIIKKKHPVLIEYLRDKEKKQKIIADNIRNNLHGEDEKKILKLKEIEVGLKQTKDLLIKLEER